MNRRIIHTAGAAAAGLLAAAFLPIATAFADTTNGDAPAQVAVAAPAPGPAPVAAPAPAAANGPAAKADDAGALHHKVCVPQTVGPNWVGAFHCVLVP